MKLSLKGNGKFYIIGAIIVAFLAYKFVLPKLRGGNGEQPPITAPPFPAPMAPPSPTGAIPIGGDPGFVSGGGIGTYGQSAPGPQFQQTTMPLTSVTAARVRLV